jgi:hypothetical protein
MCALRAVDLAQGRGAPSSPWQAFVRVRAGACSRRSGTHPLSLSCSLAAKELWRAGGGGGRRGRGRSRGAEARVRRLQPQPRVRRRRAGGGGGLKCGRRATAERRARSARASFVAAQSFTVKSLHTVCGFYIARLTPLYRIGSRGSRFAHAQNSEWRARRKRRGRPLQTVRHCTAYAIALVWRG